MESRGLILQPRDKELLELLSRYQLLSTVQIARLLFSNVAHTTMMRRLRILEDHKILHRGVPLDSGINTWIIGKNARLLLGYPRSRASMNRNSIGHDVIVTDIRMILEKLNLFHEFKSEWELKSDLGKWRRSVGASSEQVSDLLLKAFHKGKEISVAVEIERTRKSSKRYKSILWNYSGKSKINYLWYIVRTTEIGQAILDCVKESTFPLDRLLLIREDHFQRDLDEIKIFVANTKERIPVSEFFRKTID